MWEFKGGGSGWGEGVSFSNVVNLRFWTLAIATFLRRGTLYGIYTDLSTEIMAIIPNIKPKNARDRANIKPKSSEVAADSCRKNLREMVRRIVWESVTGCCTNVACLATEGSRPSPIPAGINL